MSFVSPPAHRVLTDHLLLSSSVTNQGGKEESKDVHGTVRSLLQLNTRRCVSKDESDAKRLVHFAAQTSKDL